MVTLVNRAKVNTTTTGTGTINLGSAVDGYQTFADAGVVNTNVVRYTIEDGEAWEIGSGTYSSGTLTRSLDESSTGSLLNLSGEAVVYVTATGSDLLQPSDIGSTVQGYDANIVSDASYVHTDNNYTTTEKNKLAGIEAGATADQTKADIDALGIAASTANTLATTRNIALTGAVTGNVNFDGSGNVSITTTATSDPTLTLSGDVSGSATFTNLGNATLTATVADDSHNHVISNVDGLQTALDAKLASSSYTASDVLTKVKTVDGAGSGLDADTIDGYQTSQSESINTVAIRNSSGYLFANYFNGTGTFATTGATSGMGRFTGTNGTDTYGRSYTAQAAATLLSGSTMDISGTATNITQYTVNQSVGSGNSPSFAGLNINGNLNAVDNIHLAGTLYHEGDTDTYLSFGTDIIVLRTGGTDRIYVNNSGVRLGDTGNGYFQPVSGSYGSIQIDGGAHNGFEGYSIGGRAVFMHDNSATMGLYDDVNNEWGIQYTFNGAVNLYYNGASKLDTLSNGVSINGNLYTDGSNAEDYDALSGTSPTCNVDNAGAFSLTMTGNTTFTFSGADSGWSMGFILQLTGNGSTVTWPTSVDWAGGTAPDAPASGETDIYVFWTRDGGTTWYGVQSVDAAG